MSDEITAPDPREYQSKILEVAKENNTLVVLPTGLGKCLEFSQPVLFSDGSLMEIGKYYEEELKNARKFQENKNHIILKPSIKKKVWSLNEKLQFEEREIIAIHKIKTSTPLLKISTFAGAEITLTPEHPLLTINDKIEWKKAEKFKENEPIATPSFLPEPKNTPKINPIEIFSNINYNVSCIVELKREYAIKWCIDSEINLKDLLKKKKQKEIINAINRIYLTGSKANKTKITVPLEITEDLLYFIGLVIAEASVHGGIKFYNEDKKLLNIFVNLSKKLFNINPEKIKGGLILRSTALFFFIKNVFGLYQRQHSRDKYIHNNVMCCPNNEVKEFISAMYDGEGSVRKDGLIEFMSASRNLASSMCYLLERFGIKPRLSKKTSWATNSSHPIKRNYWRIYITGKKDLEIFQNKIGFKHEEKKERLKKYLEKNIEYNPNWNLIPIDGNEVRQIRQELGLSSTKWKDFELPSIDTYERNERKFSHETLKKVIGGFKKVDKISNVNKKKIEFLENLLNSQIYWDRIKKIEKMNKDWVYDITVEKNHNFIAGINGGIIAHNTLIAFMLAIHRLKQFPTSKILILAPTRPLIEQHFQYFRKHIPELFADVQMFTGEVPAKDRTKIFQTADVILSTPQCIANDIHSELYTLQAVSLLVIDEAHRCLKNYDYTKVVSRYKMQSKNTRILGLTASPGHDPEKIKQICQHLDIEQIEIRSRDSEDVKPYVKELEFEKVEIPFPQEFIEMRVLLRRIWDSKVEQLRSRHLLFGPANKITLLKLQARLATQASPSNFQAMIGMSLTAQAIKISHAIELLETQTLSGLNSYLQGLVQQALEKKTKGVQTLVNSGEFQATLLSLNNLLKKDREHPKVEELAVILENEFKENKNSKVMIFTQFRDTASVIMSRLSKITEIRPAIFVGQAKKSSLSGSSGLSQKEQKAIIEKFKTGEINVIIATSIGEEGLDIPEVNAVIFYEPIPSAIRKIQRAGRTARLSKGKLKILVTKDTRDEINHYASGAREKKMHKSIQSIKEELKQKNKNPSLHKFI